MPNYEQKPVIKIDEQSEALTSYAALAKKLKGFSIIETYPGVRVSEIIEGLKNGGYQGHIELSENFSPYTETSFREAIMDDLTEDRVFGKLSEKNYASFFDLAKINDFKGKNAKANVLVIGIGAYLFKTPEATLIYADLPRWEIQLRYRQKERVFFKNGLESETLRNFKRGYFVEWRMADRIKKAIWKDIDIFLDTTLVNKPVALPMQLVRDSLLQAARRPFRLVPYFDAGVWGGKWMGKKLGLGQNQHGNWAWGFDGVPEENSLLFEFSDKVRVEMPAINLVFFESKKLLGERVWNRFGEEFPIRFDFLDTVQGQNLSLQVHPTTQYIRDQFRMFYTQEESYYILDVDESEKPSCYLGLKDDVTLEEFGQALQRAQKTNKFKVEKYVNRYPVKKHDHLSHPAGCIHSSAKGCVVLEISATPYIFTFKLWDWARVDFDGKPRPINIDRGLEVIQPEYNSTKTAKECVSPFVTILNSHGVKIERTGLHPSQFIESQRYTLEPGASAILSCNESVNMLNLVEGSSAIIESLNGEFVPLEVHYAETFIVPESCVQFKVKAKGQEKIMLLQAFVRTSATKAN